MTRLPNASDGDGSSDDCIGKPVVMTHMGRLGKKPVDPHIYASYTYYFIDAHHPLDQIYPRLHSYHPCPVKTRQHKSLLSDRDHSDTL